MSDLTARDLHGEYGSMLAAVSKRGIGMKRLWHQLRIDKEGGYSSWFLLETSRAGEGKIREFTGLAAAIRAFNE